MKTKILRIVLIVFSLASAIFGWIFLSGNTFGLENSWIGTLVSFFIFFISISIFIVVTKEILWSTLLLGAAFLLSFFFVFNLIHLGIILLAWFFAFSGVYLIRQDLKFRLKIDMVKSFRFGKSFLVLALALVISSIYFFKLNNEEEIVLLKNFEVENVLGKDLTMQLVKKIVPGIDNLNGGLTVDESILKSYEEQKQNLGTIGNVSQLNLDSLAKSQFLAEGRSQISQLVGRDVSGDEKIEELMAEIVSNKVNSIITPEFSKKNQEIVAGSLAALLFLSIWSLGSLAAIFLVILAKGVFWILVKSGIVQINKIPAEKEVIA